MATQPPKLKSTKDSGLCVMCANAATFECKICKSQIYCSKICQKSDWSCYKLLCDTPKDCTKRPSKAHRRCVIFPVDQETPRFAMLPVGADGSDNDAVRMLLGGSMTGRTLVWSNERLCRRQKRAVGIRYAESYLADGNAPNQSISRTTDGIATACYAGVFVALACGVREDMENNTSGAEEDDPNEQIDDIEANEDMEDAQTDLEESSDGGRATVDGEDTETEPDLDDVPLVYHDFSMADLRNLVDSLSSRCLPHFRSVLGKDDATPMFSEGLKVLCYAHQRDLPIPHAEIVHIPWNP